ncbi:MAG TPA: hypothetical protein VGH87_15085 [Polyangiaceae bacterium]
MADKDEGDLAEVERALSVLGGRHPNQVRAEREAHEAAAKRAKEHEARRAGDRKRVLKRNAIAGALVLVLGGAGFFAWRASSARSAIDTKMKIEVAPFVAAGFEVLPRGSFAAEDRADVTTVAGDCYALVAADGAQMKIERPIGSAGAKGSAILCTCASENVIVTTAGSAPVRALHIAGNALGGSRAVPYRFDKPPTVIAGDEACSDDALAAFAREKRWSAKQDKDGAWLAAHPAFASSGFTTVASAPEKLPFAFAEPTMSRCFVASGKDMTLWAISDQVQKPLKGDGVLGWCVDGSGGTSKTKETTFAVEHVSGLVRIASAPSKRIGGLLGLREIAARAGVTMTTWVRDEERGEIAADALRASLVPDPIAVPSQTIEAAQTKDARVLVFSSPTRESFTSSEADFRCAPALGEPDALCVQLRALTWHAPPPGVVVGAAYGPLPFWMSALSDLHGATVVDAELALIGFARKMAQRGFSPSVIEGVTEREGSVEILGRSGDDAIVAVGLWPKEPYIHPWSDEVPWTLDGEPRVLPLGGGARVSLPVPKNVNDGSVPVEKRRTVVFRHAVSG